MIYESQRKKRKTKKSREKDREEHWKDAITKEGGGGVWK